jgi:hypothetical protein
MQPVVTELLTYSSLFHGSLKLSRLQGFKYNIQQPSCSRVDTSEVSRKLSIDPYIYILTLLRYSYHLARTTVVWSFQANTCEFYLVHIRALIVLTLLPEYIKYTPWIWPFKGWNMLEWRMILIKWQFSDMRVYFPVFMRLVNLSCGFIYTLS